MTEVQQWLQRLTPEELAAWRHYATAQHSPEAARLLEAERERREAKR